MKTTTLLLALLLSTIVMSQQAPIKWKEIPIEDLKMTSYDIEPSAPAVILCDYGQIYFDTNPNGKNLFVFYKRHVRIKILKPEGLKYANVRIPFHDMLCEKLEGENSKIIKGMVYNLGNNGKLIATKLKSKDIKYIDSTNCIRIAELSFPDLKPGSIIEYSYLIPTLDFIQPKSWNFQAYIPTIYSEFRMRVPRPFQYMFSSPNISDFNLSEESSYVSKVTYFPKGYIPAKIDMSGNQMRFVMQNIEAFNCPNFITKPDDYMQKMNIHLVSAIQETMSRAWKEATYSLMITTHKDYEDYEPIQRSNLPYPSGYKLYKLTDWEKFNTNMLSSKEFGLPLITFWEYQDHLTNILNNKISPTDKMMAIYDYIRKNIKWNKEYNIEVNSVHSRFITKVYTKVTKKLIKEKSLAEPFENKEGSNSEINFILIYLLNKAQIEAHPVIISTRDNGKIDQNIPDAKQFNHVLALVKIDNREFLLDATDSLRPYQLLDVNDLNSTGLVIKSKDFGWIPISNNVISETRTHEKIILDDNMNFSRKTIINENGYDALNHRKEILSIGKDNFINNYKTQHLNSSPDKQLDIKNIENDTLPLILAITQSKNIEKEKEISFQVNFNPVYKAEDFTESFRKFPIDFNYPFIKTYRLEIGISNDFTVELPSNETYSTFGGKASFNYEVSLNQNKIELKIELQILQSEFPAVEYSNLAGLFDKLNDKLMENIIIRKNESVVSE